MSESALSRRGFLAWPATLAATTRRAKRIVFIADLPSHGFAEHECNASCVLLASRLREALPGVDTVVHRDGWPARRGVLRGASALVLLTNGGEGHPALKHLDDIGELMDRGGGLSVFHWGLEVPKGPVGKRFLDWIGGHYEQHWSVNPAWTARFEKIPRHPVTRGVKPFAIFDEWHYHMRFRESMVGITSLLSAVPPDSTRDGDFGPHTGNAAVRARKGMPEILAWGYERPGGGRGFGFTGGHFIWVWTQDDYRKLALNAIAWIAGIDPPEGGIASRRPSFEELMDGLDKPAPPGFTREQAEEMIRPR